MSDRLDDAIDRAVREMLDVEPRADLRARVIARLPASGSRLPAFAFRRNRVVFAAAAAALILLALVVARRSEPLPQAPVVAGAPDQHLPPEAAPRQPGGPTPPRHVVAPVGRAVAGVPRAPSAGTVIATANRGDDPAVDGIEPLNRIAPIAMTPIVQNSIAPAEIAVRPLNAIAEVQIAPLTPPDRR